MQNRYIGDVGDCGKYGMLKILSRKLSLGVLWYLVPNESHNADGKHTSYLNDKDKFKLKDCDPELYIALQNIVKNEKRNVEKVKEVGILPPKTVFCEEHVPSRADERSRWLKSALAQVAESDIVFLDPDNGLRENGKSRKHVALEEVRELYENGKRNVIVYHHTSRLGKVKEQAARWKEKLVRKLGISVEDIIVLQYHRGTSRIYFIVKAPQHRFEIHKRVRELLDSCWGKGGHFTLTGSPDAQRKNRCKN